MSSNTRIYKKRFFWMVSLITLPLIFLSVAGGYLAREEIRHQTLNGLETLAASQKQRVKQVLANYTTIHKGIASRTQLRANLNDYNVTRSASAVESSKTILSDASTPFKDIKGILLFDSTGNVMIDTRPNAVPARLHKELFSAGSNKTTIKTVRLDQNNHSIIHADSIKHNGNVIGVLVIVFDAEALKAVTDETAGLGESGETVLGYRDGDNAVLFPTRLKMSDDLVVISKDSPLPIIPTLHNKKDLVFENAHDYRGQKIVAATGYIEEADWAVVTKKDHSEIFRDLATFTTVYIFIVIVLLTVTIFLALVSL